ncbi:MAG: hypothetical protein ACKOWC_05100 [Limnohabitans sp.]
MIARLWLRLKVWGRRLTIAGACLYVLAVIDMSTSYEPTCPLEEHTFAGQKFDIEICLNQGVYEQRYLGLGVYAKSGQLLAVRKSTFDTRINTNYLAFEDDKIRYSHFPESMHDDGPADCVLKMPPGRLDWIEARLPGGIPGLGHCAREDRQIIYKAIDAWEAWEPGYLQRRREAALAKKAAQTDAPAAEASRP